MEVTSFRTATEDDRDGIVALWKSVGLGGDAAVDAREISERLRYPDDFFVVAEVDGSIVAAAMGCYDAHRGWLKRVAVDPGRQGSGTGAELVAEVERRFLAAGISKLRLAVWEGNNRGAAFWANQGYTELPDIRYFTKDLLGQTDDGC